MTFQIRDIFKDSSELELVKQGIGEILIKMRQKYLHLIQEL